MPIPHEPDANAPAPDATRREHAPETDASIRERAGACWMSVDEVAALEGVKARTVQKRAASGKYEARRVPSESGGDRWEIEASAIIEAHEARERDANAGESGTTVREQAPGETPRDANLNATTREQSRPSREEEQREEILFLRGLVEQRDRDAAELRAALREALRAMPKQLEQGTPPIEPSAPTIEAVMTESKRGFWDWMMGRK